MNIERWYAAIWGIPLIAIVFILGNKYVVDILFTITSIMCLYEYFDSFKGKAHPIKEVGYFAALLIPFIHLLSYNELPYLLLVIPVSMVWIFLRIIVSEMEITIYDGAISLLGVIYIVGFSIFMPIIFGLDNGKIFIWYVMMASWGCDAFAYIIGMAFGKHKFTKISPKKSIEGAIGGIVGGTFLMLIYTIILNRVVPDFNMSYIYITVIGIILCIVGQIGDLAASSIKRYAKVKDFSNLIPGHGGMLDRLDSVIFVAPFAFFFLKVLI